MKSLFRADLYILVHVIVRLRADIIIRHSPLDRWAALWPFIGIVVEVTVLVAAILLYERHQIRSKPTAASATDNNANVDVNAPANGQAGPDK